MAEIYAAKSPEITQREIDHMELSRKLAQECVVLLENDGTLPLGTGGRIALFGCGAEHTVKGGTGSGDVNTRINVNVREGLTKAGYTVTTEDWISRQREKYAEAKEAYVRRVHERAESEEISEILASFSDPFKEPAPAEITEQDIRQSDTDTAVYVISRNAGEGADRWDRRGDYYLYEEEREQLARLAAAYDRFVLVLNIGGVMDMTEIKAIPGINAVVLMSQLGNIGGLAIADILSGKATPSGKLTDTWAEQYGDYPSSAGFSHNDGNVDDEYYTEGIYVGYRYFDTFDVDPVYCFGYGKSYTEFEIRPESAEAEKGEITVRVNVKNTGNTYAGKEVVQVYYSAPQVELAKPYQELVAFAKTKLLAPGEEETLVISFPVKNMASYSEARAAWVLEAGEYVIRVGNSSRDTVPAAVLELDEPVRTEQLKNLFGDGADGKTEKIEEIIPPEAESIGDTEAPEDPDVPEIRLRTCDIETSAAVYQGERQEYVTEQTGILTAEDIRAGKCTVEELTAQLTVEELADLCVGTLRAEEGSIVGNASGLVPGAAADTSAILAESRGIKSMILADGPAGLRLQPVFKTTKEGGLLPGGTVMGDICEPFDPQYTDENSDTWYQYCTAMPIGWALAQSWNTELLERAGDMIGREMEIFGVDLWLAPALNIHRNPLCGRNFEYYSEDPYVSGRIAAAITKGVQSHRGKGVTLKHFAVNNQEDNRYFTNSHVSERALREIYLKGFEIAVRESRPMSIMTSYNLLNGTHTANHRELLQAAARDEWGFDGVVMTDWFTSQDQPQFTGKLPKAYPISASTGCVCAGNDMQMPGCKKNVDDLVEAVRTGKETDGYRITLADLQFCAANVIRAALRTDV